MLPSLFRRVAGESFNIMSEPVRRVHDVTAPTSSSGRCSVEHGGNILARFLVWLMRMPPETSDAPIVVTIWRENGREVWLRSVDGWRFSSTLAVAAPGVLSESMGPVRFLFKLDVAREGFGLVVVGFRFFGIPLPRFLHPDVRAAEVGHGTAAAFDISVRLPLVGPIVAYRGEIEPDNVSEDARPGLPVMLFDGVCNFCNRGVDFYLRRDTHARIRFAVLQSPRGLELLRKHNLPLDDYKTFIVLDGERVIEKSDAILHLLSHLRWPWPALRCLKLVPKSLRDAAYDLIARNRYRIMGKRETCRVPSEAERARFLGPPAEP